MIEMCVVVACLSLLFVMCSPIFYTAESAYYLFPNGYLHAQSQALASALPITYNDPEEPMPVCSFNNKGNVSSAKTLILGARGRAIVVELGGGRLVFR